MSPELWRAVKKSPIKSSSFVAHDDDHEDAVLKGARESGENGRGGGSNEMGSGMLITAGGEVTTRRGGRSGETTSVEREVWGVSVLVGVLGRWGDWPRSNESGVRSRLIFGVAMMGLERCMNEFALGGEDGK